jgi:predicted nucleotide-binding protein
MEIYPSQSPEQPPPPLPILDKLRKIHSRGLEILKNPKFQIGVAIKWLEVLNGILIPLYGRSQPIMEISRKKVLSARKNGIQREIFEMEVANLKGLINQLEYSAGAGLLNAFSIPSLPPSGKNVFIIHGHDEPNTPRLTLLLQNHFHVDPIIMGTEPGMSRTLIKKFEDTASICTFAFAIVTPDDEIVSPKGNYHQARPNVIFELGWFVGRLGKHRVIILLKEGAQIHSDFDGVSRIQFRDNVEEKFLEIQGELSVCGLI